MTQSTTSRFPGVQRAASAFVVALFSQFGCAEIPLPEPGIAGDGRLDEALKGIRSAYELPALAGFILEGSSIRELAAVGFRVAGETASVTAKDRWHIGSNTKAMTATLAAVYVEGDHLQWETTLKELLPGQASIHPKYHEVRFEELLTHRSGLPANDLKAYQMSSRRQLVAHVLSRPPEKNRGEFLYSNLGYIVAGYILEQLGNDTWENLLTKELFEPLNIMTGGFGPPAFPSKDDQPWGHALHRGEWFALDPDSKLADNPPVLGPAGTVSISLQDYAKFVALHLQGAQGKANLLRAQSFEKLHTPPQDEEYALGWGIVEREWGGGEVLTHSGSNTMWYATVWIAPKQDMAVFAVTNAGGGKTAEAVDKACWTLIQRALADDE